MPRYSIHLMSLRHNVFHLNRCLVYCSAAKVAHKTHEEIVQCVHSEIVTRMLDETIDMAPLQHMVDTLLSDDQVG